MMQIIIKYNLKIIIKKYAKIMQHHHAMNFFFQSRNKKSALDVSLSLKR